MPNQLRGVSVVSETEAQLYSYGGQYRNRAETMEETALLASSGSSRKHQQDDCKSCKIQSPGIWNWRCYGTRNHSHGTFG